MKSKLTKLIGATVMLLTPLVGQNFTSVQADSSVAPYTAGAMSPLSGTLMASYDEGQKNVRVYSEPSYSSPTQQFVPNGSNWQVFGTQNGFYNIGKNQWIPGEYAVYQSESFSKVGYVRFEPKYRVVLTRSLNIGMGPEDPDAYLYHGEKIKISQKAFVRGGYWYKVEGASYLDYPEFQKYHNNWIEAKYVSWKPVYTPVEGWGQISYIPGYGVRVYQSPDTSKPTNQYLKHGTKWKIFGYQEGYFQMGKNQWVPAPYIGARQLD